ncbi:MAG: Hpt domain-containing protein [Thiothrix sp.]|jgi:HPt (histidine-containing phosphotransfer) domain-containing protein|uniref:Hpt domain-containing protein n=1 Tax=Thiothrix sp. TaxID=1032 RepID=UPI00261C20A0|nr:Hpt domain-containing protein [Thiothrix sp.]MDD5392385.1 Hpt domain-containing protein [Thiothrix sp.]
MTTMTSPSVDDQTYTMLQEIMADEFGELVDFFRKDTQQGVDVLKICIDAGDSEQVGSICHKMKSSSKLIGAFRLAEFARLLEEYKTDQDQTRAQENWQSLREECADVMCWLDQQTATS